MAIVYIFYTKKVFTISNIFFKVNVIPVPVLPPVESVLSSSSTKIHNQQVQKAKGKFEFLILFTCEITFLFYDM